MTRAKRSSTDEMLERIRGIAVDGLRHPDAGSLLHAYIACLSVAGTLSIHRRNSRGPSETALGLVGGGWSAYFATAASRNATASMSTT